MEVKGYGKTGKNKGRRSIKQKAEEMREIKFYDVALELGYKHIKTEDVKTIATRFLKKHPTYRAVRFVKDPNRVSSTESLFTTLVLTECEYQTEEEFLEEMQ